MPHRDLLSPAQRAQLLSLPTSLREIGELYTLTPADHEFIGKRRTAINRLGMAVQLCFLRFPGRPWTPEETMPAAMQRFIAQQIEGSPPDLAVNRWTSFLRTHLTTSANGFRSLMTHGRAMPSTPHGASDG
jgi:TnpA family transposase